MFVQKNVGLLIPDVETHADRDCQRAYHAIERTRHKKIIDITLQDHHYCSKHSKNEDEAEYGIHDQKSVDLVFRELISRVNHSSWLAFVDRVIDTCLPLLKNRLNFRLHSFICSSCSGTLSFISSGCFSGISLIMSTYRFTLSLIISTYRGTLIFVRRAHL